MDPRASIAVHRFGLGEADAAVATADPAAWLNAQIGPAEAPAGRDLPGSAAALKLLPAFVAAQRRKAAGTGTPAGGGVEEDFRRHFRQAVFAELEARWTVATTTRRPFAERLALFWANHFTVSAAKPRVAGLVGPFEREAIRPHLAGPFRELLRAAVLHPAMLLYLDNAQSIGPDSRAGRASGRGLNENLAREILELHTLGVDGGYTQADVIAFARVLTGWTVDPEAGGARFLPRRHQPGPHTLLGARLGADGAAALDAALDRLALHPATARHLAGALARHFVADEPPAALVARLAARFLDTRGDLAAVYRALVESPEAWSPGFPKLKRPEDLAVSTWRLLGWRTRLVEGIGIAVREMGQPVGAAPSPAGWPDRAGDWLGPDAMWKRIEWVAQVAHRAPVGIDTRALAQASLGERLSAATRTQIEQAESGRQALALLLAAPEFQRR